MKSIKLFILAFCLVLASSCSLDQLVDPNNVKLSGLRPTLVLSSIQSSTAGLFQATSTVGMQVTRLQNPGGANYSNVFTPQSFDGIWSLAYAGILQDADNVIKYADQNGWSRHGGMARVLSAFTLLQLVDLFGDVPYKETLKGLDNLNAKVDLGADIYISILAMLDQAILDFKTNQTTNVPSGKLNPLAETPVDFYYGNNYANWIRLINSLKLKIYLNISNENDNDISLTWPGNLKSVAFATAGINGVIASADGFITAQNHNFVFRYGTNLSDPDSRHPNFIGQYPAGGGAYMSNHLIWQMFHAYGATNLVGTTTKSANPGDPRMRFYFYRQTNANNTDPNNIRCVTATSIPAHFPAKVGSAIVYGVAGIPPGISTDPNNAAWSGATGTLSRTFCYPTSVGYWGRDHVNNEGIPPDNLLRTAWGAYPAGGRFDGSSQQGVNATTRGGMFGAGIQPMMMRSFVQFMLAEAALKLSTTGTAKTYYSTGINYSFTDVRDWAVNGTYGIGSPVATEAIAGSNGSTGINTFYTATDYAADVANYLTAANAAYDAALAVSSNDALNYVAREFWVAAFGNGMEAYNLYRRTGMPTGMQPTIQPNPGAFPRSVWYPNTFATLNNTVDQKINLSGKVFWNANTSNLDF
jgi:hypothetical protein